MSRQGFAKQTPPGCYNPVGFQSHIVKHVDLGFHLTASFPEKVSHKETLSVP